MTASTFAPRVLAWFAEHGRKDLPWQVNPTPYRVWVSEIMLQQTQVATVIPYYQRFMDAFPDVRSLAAAPEDDVLALWAGLGYYARARNLHACAQQLVDNYGGDFPITLDEVVALPGIGRSTAGAIMTLAMGHVHPILDGNVKRVLARHQLVEGWTGSTKVQSHLWELATARTPSQQAAQYTQAMMDLGATLCTRSKPSCHRCPVQSDCQAYLQDKQAQYPNPKPKKQLPEKKALMFMLLNEQGKILLYKRPPSGIWGGLWSLPQSVIDEVAQPMEQLQDTLVSMGLGLVEHHQTWQLRHTFSHFHLNIDALVVTVNRAQGPGQHAVMDNSEQVWYNVASDKGSLGLPKPVQSLLDTLSQRSYT